MIKTIPLLSTFLILICSIIVIISPLRPVITSITPELKINQQWLTYKNDQFEFQYPNYWTKMPTSTTDQILRIGETYLSGEPGGAFPLGLEISTIPYEQKFNDRIQTDGVHIINKEEVLLNSKKYQLITYKLFSVESSFDITDYLKVGNLYLYFTHTSDGCNSPELSPVECDNKNLQNIEKYRSVRNQILSTFKFTKLPITTPTFCGGIANIPCPSGFRCQLDGKYPDAGGSCVKL